ncbi:MAG TPA: acetyl-CoA carboxylase biotin carboxylase subunit [Candidatus Kapabacteria bacterium]|nr:acetyl-CoA carboxylase biotin carboxylase subunit [Candidatus Kapabacteria bacterium]
MFSKILIANRGEIALRIIRACRELRIKTVAVYSEADRDSLHVRFADEAVCVGPAASRESYLNISRIIAAATITNADAIHPGYGFLSENADFAEICAANGFKFIGPEPGMLTAMGDKAIAKDTMRKAGVPVVPGSDGVVHTMHDLHKVAEQTGYPLLIKAVAGGGGRGMRLVHSKEELEKMYSMARAEAETAFNNSDVYVEKFVEGPRHVEIQVFGDTHGTAVHYNERECSIQRRHQKLIEEAPSPVMTPELRAKMGAAAVKGVKAVNYVGAGTIEFLVDKYRNFYFMEMNTRIQVEHCVTEESHGIDLIKQQIAVALGEKISKTQVKPFQHSIECRINAEDVFHDFRPTPGTITALHFPGGRGVRVDSHIYQGYTIPPTYDSMLAKLICSAPTRQEALDKMRTALDEFVIEGVPTTIPFHRRMMEQPDFVSGEFDTTFLETHDWKQEG